VNRSERRAHWRQQNRARIAALSPLWNEPRSTDRAITLHINELVLHGFPLQTRHAIGDATQSELTRLLSATGLPQFVKTQGRSDAIDGGSFKLTPASRPAAVGSLIANAVYGGQRR
jgi:hypothetical protein